MIMAEGKSILSQVAYGRLRFVQRHPPELAEYSSRTWGEES